MLELQQSDLVQHLNLSGGTPSLPTASGSISLISFTMHKTGAAGTTLLAGSSVNFS